MNSNKAFTITLRTMLRIYLGLLSLSVLFPLFWSVFSSFKTTPEFFKDPWALPSHINWENYIRAWNQVDLGTNFMNSLFVTLVVVAATTLLGAMTAYACTRLGLKAGRMVTMYYLMGMFVPTILCVVTIFLQMRDLHLLDKTFGLILLYIALSMPFTVFVLSGFFRTLPHELEEAALIDGCGPMRTFWQIMLPLAKPGLATVCIFNFLSIWNEYVLASVIILDKEKITLPVALVALKATSEYSADWGALFAGLVIVMIPLIIIYLTFQKHITSGVTTGAIKG